VGTTFGLIGLLIFESGLGAILMFFPKARNCIFALLALVNHIRIARPNPESEPWPVSQTLSPPCRHLYEVIIKSKTLWIIQFKRFQNFKYIGKFEYWTVWYSDDLNYTKKHIEKNNNNSGPLQITCSISKTIPYSPELFDNRSFYKASIQMVKKLEIRSSNSSCCKNTKINFFFNNVTILDPSKSDLAFQFYSLR
jgi:hypothetical protein